MLPDFLITPRQLVQDREIQPLDCHVYGIIYWYTHMRLQTCTASNEHISGLLGVSKSGVNKAIVRLVKKRYVLSLYDRKHHTRTLIPQITFRQENTPPETTDPNGTVAVSQTSPNEQAVSQTGKGSVPNGKKSQLQTASPNNNSKQEKEDIYKYISSGTHVPNGREKGITAAQQNIYGNEEVNEIIAAFTSRIGRIPADKKPRQVAHNIRQIIHTFIKHNTDLFQTVQGQPLTFEYVHQKCWEWYLTKNYAPHTEKLETVKLKVRVYLDYLSQQLKKGAVSKDSDKHDNAAGRPLLNVERTKQKQEPEAQYREMKESPMYELFLAQKEAARQRNWARVKALAVQARHIPLATA